MDLEKKKSILGLRRIVGTHSFWLGTPQKISVRRGGDAFDAITLEYLTLSTSCGFNETFSLALYPHDIYKITEELWRAYHGIDSKAAEESFRKIVRKIRKFAKRKTRTEEEIASGMQECLSEVEYANKWVCIFGQKGKLIKIARNSWEALHEEAQKRADTNYALFFVPKK